VDSARASFQCHKCYDHGQADVYPVRLSKLARCLTRMLTLVQASDAGG
jgi:hypothetical protein